MAGVLVEIRTKRLKNPSSRALPLNQSDEPTDTVQPGCWVNDRPVTLQYISSRPQNPSSSRLFSFTKALTSRAFCCSYNGALCSSSYTASGCITVLSNEFKNMWTSLQALSQQLPVSEGRFEPTGYIYGNRVAVMEIELGTARSSPQRALRHFQVAVMEVISKSNLIKFIA
jgi:hypothetical protein